MYMCTFGIGSTVFVCAYGGWIYVIWARTLCAAYIRNTFGVPIYTRKPGPCYIIIDIPICGIFGYYDWYHVVCCYRSNYYSWIGRAGDGFSLYYRNDCFSIQHYTSVGSNFDVWPRNRAERLIYTLKSKFIMCFATYMQFDKFPWKNFLSIYYSQMLRSSRW